MVVVLLSLDMPWTSPFVLVTAGLALGVPLILNLLELRADLAEYKRAKAELAKAMAAVDELEREKK